jgi:hypothetical protein
MTTRRYNTGVSRLFLCVLGGLALALVFTASPLGIAVLCMAPVVALLAGRHLDARDRRILLTVLAAAFAARLAAVLLLFVSGLPDVNSLSLGSLTGDQAYNVGRALRARDILRGFGDLTHYDYFVATDEYGRTSYIGLLTALQLLFGPSPFGLRLLNAALFLAGAAVLFRAIRPRYGRLPAALALIVVAFLPSLLYASISVLKEALYFLASSVVLASAIALGRIRNPLKVFALVLVIGGCLWILDDLRRGAVVLVLGGLACGIVIRLIGATSRPFAITAAAAGIALILVATVPSLQKRALDGVTAAAKQHTGHVFTVGHAYKLLDDGFYMNPSTPAASTISLTPGQAIRFVARGVATFLLTPLPWEARSLGEKAFWPEHLLWYTLLLSLPFGIAEGWRRDAWATAMIVGFVLPMAITLALTNGNVGTLLRLRGLVTPYIAWVSALGFCVVADRVCAMRRQAKQVNRGPQPAENQA